MRHTHRAGEGRGRSTGRLKPAVRGLALLAALAAPLTAQSPPLPAGRDPSDWRSYYDQGLRELTRRPAIAEGYFVYAARLDPGVAEPLVGRYAAWYRARPWLRSPLWTEHAVAPPRAEALTPETWLEDAALRDPFVELTPLGATVPQDQGFREGDAMALGMRALLEERWEESAAQLSAALRADRGRWEAYRWRGLAYARLGRWDDAAADHAALIAHLETLYATHTVSLGPSLAALRHALALIELRRGRSDSAAALLRSAIGDDLSYAAAHFAYAELLVARGDTGTALAEYAFAVLLRPEDAVFRDRYGTVLLESGRMTAALNEFDEAVRLSPDYALPYFGRARCLERAGQPVEAAAMYLAFLARAPQRLAPLIEQAKERLAAP